MSNLIEENRITGIIWNCSFEIHRDLGPGLLESAYEKCLLLELKKRGLHVDCQKELPIHFKTNVIPSAFRTDMIVNNRVIIEIKSVRKIEPIHEAQILTYLKLSGIKIGLLINFNEKLIKNGYKRYILNR